MSAIDLPGRVATVRPSFDARAAALVAGFSTLAMGVIGILSNVALLVLLGEGPDAAAARVADGRLLLGLAITGFLAVAILDVVLAWAIVRFFGAGRHGGLPVLAGWLRLAYAAVLATAVGQLGVALAPAGGMQEGDAAYSALLAFQTTWQLGLVVFAAHLAVLGAIVVRDSATPTWLGAIILVAALAYAFDGIARVFLPADAIALAIGVAVVTVSSIVGECGLAIWFLARGGRRG